MEKEMVQKHKEQRNKGGERENKSKKCFHGKLFQVITVVCCYTMKDQRKTRLTNI
jgi:hypothetical protein